jgi:hypothetical protein
MRSGAVHPDIELIVTSGAVGVEEVDLPDNGIFLPKPYPPERVVEIVARKLDAAND